jgi:hypothetical protein
MMKYPYAACEMGLSAPYAFRRLRQLSVTGLSDAGLRISSTLTAADHQLVIARDDGGCGICALQSATLHLRENNSYLL